MTTKLKDILKYRSLLMGIAMILIVIFHMGLTFKLEWIQRIYDNLAGGVEIFLFLSGLGIAQSLNKNDNIKEFYKRRAIRILPTTIPLIIILGYCMMVTNRSFGGTEYYSVITGLGFLLYKGNYPLIMWYIPCIIIYYLISPFIYRFLKQDLNSKFYLKATLLILILLLIPGGSTNITIRFLFARLPIYIIGMIYGMRIINKEDYKKGEKPTIFLLSIAAIAGIWYLENINKFYLIQFKYVLFTPIVLSIIIIFSSLFNLLKKEPKLLSLIGQSTLAIYCSHEFIKFSCLGIISRFKLHSLIHYKVLPYEILFAIIAITFGILWNKFITWMQKK